MTLPTIVVELSLGGSWVDVTTPNNYLDTGSQGAPLVITRGRSNEQDSAAAGVCTFSLVNDDGRFTLGQSAGAYWPHFDLWVPVRVTVNGRQEFQGYVSNVETTWDDETGAQSHSAITCTDVLGMMAMSPVLTSWATEVIEDLAPLYWWPLSDPEGSTSAAPSAGTTSLVASVADTDERIDSVIKFGEAGAGSLEADAQVSFEAAAWSESVPGAPVRAYLTNSAPLAGLGSAFTVLAIVTQPEEASEDNVSGGIWTMTWGGTKTLKVSRINRDQIYLEDGAPAGPNYATGAGFFAPGSPRLVAVAITSSQMRLFGADLTVARLNSDSLNGATFALGGAGQGAMAHVAIVNRVLTDAEYLDLSAKLAGDGSALVSTWLDRAIESAGISTSVSATYDRPMHRAALKGSNPAEIGSTLASSCGGMFVASVAGVPTWIDPTYCPAAVEVAAADISDVAAWAPDSSLYYSEVQVDDVVAGNRGTFPRQALSLPGLLPGDDLTSYVDWLVSTGSVYGGARMANVTVDLLTNPSTATTAAYQALDLRSRIYVSGLPSQIPVCVMTAEGYTLTVSGDVWTKSLNTAPDPRFVLDEPAAELDSTYRLYL